VLVLAADHAIRKPCEFRQACLHAAAAAGRIITFGIEPTDAVANYGYERSISWLEVVQREIDRVFGDGHNISILNVIRRFS
jgi:mannose-1-phosphate guanylyltransferase